MEDDWRAGAWLATRGMFIGHLEQQVVWPGGPSRKEGRNDELRLMASFLAPTTQDAKEVLPEEASNSVVLCN